MKQLTTLISAFLFLIVGVSHVWALPNCVGPWNALTWDNCVGTYVWTSGESKGDKYIGEHKIGLAHGQGTYTFANGGKLVGEWKDGNLISD